MPLKINPRKGVLAANKYVYKLLKKTEMRNCNIWDGSDNIAAGSTKRAEKGEFSTKIHIRQNDVGGCCKTCGSARQILVIILT